jgi:hypothetical protein
MSSFLMPFGRLADEPFAADELGEHQIGAVLLAQHTERRIAHVLHGGEKERELREFDGADAGHGKGPKIRKPRRVAGLPSRLSDHRP